MKLFKPSKQPQIFGATLRNLFDGGLCPPSPPPAGIWRCDTASSVADVSNEESSWSFRRSEYEPTRFPRNVGVLWHLRRVGSSVNSLRKPKNGNSNSDLAGCDAVHTGTEDGYSILFRNFWYQITRLHVVITTNTTVSVFTALKISNYKHIYTGCLCIRRVIKKIFLKAYDYRTACYT